VTSELVQTDAGPALVHRDTGVVDVTKIPPRMRSCCRCEKLSAQAEKAGELVPPVFDVEVWGVDGRTYYAGLCAGCSDWEWSIRWNARFRKATTQDEKNLLDRERAARMARGRRYYGEAAP
jgi:hypothetical protein